MLALAVGCERFERKEPPPPPPPPEVLVTEVTTRTVPLSSEWVGSTDGVVNAQIRAKVQGYLLRQAYADGAFVRKGELLFEIDPRPFQAALDQAKGQLAQAEGQVGEAEAALGKADIDVRRYTPLAEAKAISQQELDNAIQAQLAARAGVAAAKANVDAATANVADAQLNLDFTRITSPVDGIASIATTQVGDLVGPSSGVLTTVSTVNPIRVYFPVSEQEFLKASERLGGKLSEPVKDLLEMTLSDGRTYGHRGTVVAANRQVDLRTGTVMIVGEFPNPDNILRPGQYARVRAVTRTVEDAVVIPQRAVVEVQGSFQALVVNDDDKLEVRPIELGPQVSASEVIVAKGLEGGETLVVEGTQKARPDTKVTTKEWNPAPPAKKKRATPAKRDGDEGSEPAKEGASSAG